MLKKDFGKRLRENRKQRGLTLKQFAEMIGISENYLGDVERGRKLPSMPTFVKIVNNLQISADVLLFDHVDRADILVQSELNQRVANLPAVKRKLVYDTVKCLVENLEDL